MLSYIPQNVMILELDIINISLFGQSCHLRLDEVT